MDKVNFGVICIILGSGSLILPAIGYQFTILILLNALMGGYFWIFSTALIITGLFLLSYDIFIAYFDHLKRKKQQNNKK